MTQPHIDEPRVDIVLVWHMHQPDYRDTATGDFRLPWVYLHAMKDYADMAAHLEAHPDMRAVVNFVPILLDQLEDYTDQFATGNLRDPLLRLLARTDSEPFTEAEREAVLEQCFHANHQQMIEPFPAYRRLQEIARQVEGYGRESVAYLSDWYLRDLLTWYHLSWTGETARRSSPLITELMAQGCRFTQAQRRSLFNLIGNLVAGIIPRFRALESAGTIEISTTPEYHPLTPLLVDFRSAREAVQDLPLPQAAAYPGGAQRAAWHMRAAIDTHEQRFGRRPTGVWPSEGAVSDAVIGLAGEAGFAWIASGEQVLANSLTKAAGRAPDREAFLYRPYRVPSEAPGVTCFFRDDRLSDLIGFEYRNWDGGDAARHLIGEVKAIGDRAAAGPRPIVSIILDGENAWDHYPYNAYYFLDSLYAGLEHHATIRPCTYREWLGAQPRAEDGAIAGAQPLPGVVAGSWVYGSFTTWIGSHDKNLAWDLLVSAKHAYDLVLASGRLSREETEAALRQLAICESSDWFWWFGDYNPARSVASFDRLYRANLAALYRLLHLAPPAQLDEPLSRGNSAANFDGAMRRAS